MKGYKDNRERNKAAREAKLLDGPPIANFDMPKPGEKGRSFVDGIRDFFKRNQRLIEEYPSDCAISRNAQFLEDAMRPFFSEILDEKEK